MCTIGLVRHAGHVRMQPSTWLPASQWLKWRVSQSLQIRLVSELTSPVAVRPASRHDSAAGTARHTSETAGTSNLDQEINRPVIPLCPPESPSSRHRVR